MRLQRARERAHCLSLGPLIKTLRYISWITCRMRLAASALIEYAERSEGGWQVLRATLCSE